MLASIQTIESLPSNAYFKIEPAFCCIYFICLTCYEICICSRLLQQCLAAECIWILGPIRRLETSSVETSA